MDLDTFLTTLYVFVDDWYQAEIAPTIPMRPGAKAHMSTSEVLTVALAGQWRVGVPWSSERALVRYMQTHGRGWFPHMLGRSAFNLRVRNLYGLLVKLQQAVAVWLASPDDGYQVADCLPLPACRLAQAERSDRHWLWLSRYGHGGTDSGWFYGDRLLTVVSPQGVITGWLLGSAQMNDRWLLEGLLSARAGQPALQRPPADPHEPKDRQPQLPDGYLRGWEAAGAWTPQPYLVDGNFRGRYWQRHWQDDYQAEVLSKPASRQRRQWSAAAHRWFSSLRQIVETVNARLTGVFDLHHLMAHSYWGQLTRIAARLAAYNLGLFFNRLLDRPLGALETLLC